MCWDIFVINDIMVKSKPVLALCQKKQLLKAQAEILKKKHQVLLELEAILLKQSHYLDRVYSHQTLQQIKKIHPEIAHCTDLDDAYEYADKNNMPEVCINIINYKNCGVKDLN